VVHDVVETFVLIRIVGTGAHATDHTNGQPIPEIPEKRAITVGGYLILHLSTTGTILATHTGVPRVRF